MADRVEADRGDEGDPRMTFDLEDFRARWAATGGSGVVCAATDPAETRVCILAEGHDEPHPWEAPASDDDGYLDDVPEGMLWLRLFAYADEVAPELKTTPAAWMHTQVDHWASARRSSARDRLTIHQGGSPPTRPTKRRVSTPEGDPA